MFNIITIILLVFATDTFITFANINRIPKTLFQLFGLAYILFATIINQGYFTRNKIIIFSIFFSMIFITMFVNKDFSNGNIVKLYILLLGMMITEVFTFESFKFSYTRIMSIISLISLACYCFAPLIRNITALPLISNGQKSLVCFFITNVDVSTKGIIRNWGPFWEPGVFAIYLSLSIMILLSENMVRKSLILIHVLAIFTTFSTTGYICLLLIFIGFLIPRINKLSSRYLIIIVAGIIIGFFLFVRWNIGEIIFGKFSKHSGSYESSSSRFLSIIANLICISTNWWCGVGVSKLNMIVDTFFQEKGMSVFSNTNGLLMNFSIFGCLFGIIYFIMLVGGIRRVATDSIFTFFFWTGAITLALFAEPLINSLLFNTIIFYCFVGWRESYE